jgi:hypothetical protein
VSSYPVSRAAAQNAWLREGLAAARRLGAGSGHAADGPGLASDADRERAVEVLQVTCAEGRLVKEDFAARVGRALAARTTGELTAATTPLPGPSARPAKDGTSPDGKGAAALARSAWRLMRGR